MSWSVLLAGAVLGFAGSLHCASMCGCIASGALFLTPTPNRSEQIGNAIVMNLSRVAMYALMGALVGGFGVISLDPSRTELGFRLLQWLGASVVMVVGLTMAGVLPRVTVPMGLVPYLGMSPTRYLSEVLPRRALPITVGLGWGLTPCPMVYAALFSSVLTGSTFHAAVWMTGFGLGTLPSVLGTGFGMTSLRKLRLRPGLHVAAGLSIALLGLLSLTVKPSFIAMFCQPA